MEMIILKQNCPEWEYAWDWLSNHPLNKDLENPSVALNNEEGWQYMGSYRQNGQVIHEFRHRSHPLTNDVQFLKVNASESMNAEDIEKTVPIN
jgi:hypothetical protein